MSEALNLSIDIGLCGMEYVCVHVGTCGMEYVCVGACGMDVGVCGMDIGEYGRDTHTTYMYNSCSMERAGLNTMREGLGVR